MATNYMPLIEGTFRGIAPRNWRRAAAAALGVEKDALRDAFDRELSDEEIGALLVILQRATDAAQAACTANAKRIGAAQANVSIEQDRRHTEQRLRDEEALNADAAKRYEVMMARFRREFELEEAA